MKKVLLSITMALLVVASMYAQSGLRIHAGGSAIDNEDTTLNPSGPYLGWHVGGDFQISGGSMSILLGGRYTSTTYTTNKAIYKSATEPKINMINTRIGLAFNLIKINRNFSIIGRLLGSIDYVFNEPLKLSEANSGYEAYSSINTTASGVGGLGIRVGSLTFDVEYGHGLYNVIAKKEDTKPTHYSASIGYFF